MLLRNSVAAGLLAGAMTIATPAGRAAWEWPFYGGDQGGSKYAPLDQINRDNVAKLKVA